MGFVIFLLVVAAIVVIIVLVKANKRKKKLEELKECRGYFLALKIKDELEKKGIKFHEPEMSIDAFGYAEGSIWGHDDQKSTIDIKFFSCRAPAEKHIDWFGRQMYLYSREPWKRYIGIENPNVSVLVTSWKNLDGPEPVKTDYKEVPEHIKIAAEVIENNGFGPCSLIKEPSYQ